MSRRVATGVLAALLAGAGVAGTTRPHGDDGPETEPARAPALVDVLAGAGARPADVATGFAAGAGRVVTVAHVLGHGRPVRVRAGRAKPRSAAPLRTDARLDVAILATEAALGGGGRALVVGRAVPGQRSRLVVRRAGRTVTLPAVVRRRATLRLARPEGGPPAQRAGLILAAGVRPGDSGAPLVDDAGRVTGILFARSREQTGIAYAVDAAGLVRLLRTTP